MFVLKMGRNKEKFNVKIFREGLEKFQFSGKDSPANYK